MKVNAACAPAAPAPKVIPKAIVDDDGKVSFATPEEERAYLSALPVEQAKAYFGEDWGKMSPDDPRARANELAAPAQALAAALLPAGGSDVTVLPGAGAVVVAGFAPSVTAAVATAPGIGTVTIAGAKLRIERTPAATSRSATSCAPAAGVAMMPMAIPSSLTSAGSSST